MYWRVLFQHVPSPIVEVITSEIAYIKCNRLLCDSLSPTILPYATQNELASHKMRSTEFLSTLMHSIQNTRQMNTIYLYALAGIVV